jgi:glycine cleavage system H protein
MAHQEQSASPGVTALKAVLLYPFAMVGGFFLYILLVTVLMPAAAVVHLVRFLADARYRQRTLDGAPIAAAPEVYYHRGHTRLRVDPEAAFVGPDELASAIVGGGGWALEAPAVGAEVKSGQSVWRWKSGDRCLDQVAPICGTILEVNTALLRDLTQLARAPIADSWIVKVRPTKAVREFQNLISLDQVERWHRDAQDWIFSRFGGELGAVAADGGRLVPGFASRLSDDQWQALVEREFK